LAAANLADVTKVAYDDLGRGYSGVRRADPRIARRISEALGDAHSVVNVGAGSGSYEPGDREVAAVEPSAEMIAQRPAGSAPVVQASAESLPFEDGSFDAAMAVLTIHHWTDLEAGLAEMRRVARKRILIVTFDPATLQELWIVADYFPEMLRAKPGRTSSGHLASVLPNPTTIALPVPHDCQDHFFAALWGRPELFFDADVVRPMWMWQRLSEAARQAGRDRLAADLASGAWDRKYGHLRETSELDVGLRLVVAELGGRQG
jgi:SAM-dependent methyltransferase